MMYDILVIPWLLKTKEFVNSYQTKSVDDLHKCAQNHTKAYAEDGNLGLVKQAIEALKSQNIQRLTKTYITLSFDDIATKASLENNAEVESRVFNMVSFLVLSVSLISRFVSARFSLQSMRKMA